MLPYGIPNAYGTYFLIMYDLSDGMDGWMDACTGTTGTCFLLEANFRAHPNGIQRAPTHQRSEAWAQLSQPIKIAFYLCITTDVYQLSCGPIIRRSMRCGHRLPKSVTRICLLSSMACTEYRQTSLSSKPPLARTIANLHGGWPDKPWGKITSHNQKSVA